MFRSLDCSMFHEEPCFLKELQLMLALITTLLTLERILTLLVLAVLRSVGVAHIEKQERA